MKTTAIKRKKTPVRYGPCDMRKEDFSAIDKAASKTGMTADGCDRNKKWRIAEMERRLSVPEDDLW